MVVKRHADSIESVILMPHEKSVRVRRFFSFWIHNREARKWLCMCLSTCGELKRKRHA